jgi:hypothetical protein
MTKSKPAVMFTVMVALCIGCGSSVTPLSVLRENPDLYRTTNVVVAGIVTTAGIIPVVGTRYYVLKDHTGTFPVVTRGALPEIGAKVRIHARLRPAAEFLGVTFGLHLMEISQ